jgi:hypothetical protein
MALNFHPFPEQPDERQQRFQMLLQGFGGIAQGLGQNRQQQMADQRQAMLDKYLVDKEAREKEAHAYKYGTPIDPNLSVAEPRVGVGGQSSFMPGGQAPIGTGMPLRDSFDAWMAGGMKAASARPEFMPALGADERKRFYDQTSPTAAMESEKHQAEIDLKREQANFYARRPGETGGSFMFAGTNGSGEPVFYNSKTLEPRSANVPGGGQLYSKVPTEGQQNASLFGKRAGEANEQLRALTSQGFNPASIETGVQSGLHNTMQPAEVQQFRQVKLNFIAAVLRKESGAAISPKEEEWADQQYFEQPGDKPETVRQKEINRQSAIDGLNRIAGPLAVAPSGTGGSGQPLQRTIRNKRTGETRQQVSNDGGRTWQ